MSKDKDILCDCGTVIEIRDGVPEVENFIIADGDDAIVWLQCDNCKKVHSGAVVDFDE